MSRNGGSSKRSLLPAERRATFKECRNRCALGRAVGGLGYTINQESRPVSDFDLDGDGVIDALYDNAGKDRAPKVIFEGRFVRVEDFKGGLGVARGQKPKMWGIGRKVQYVFDKGIWNEVPLE